MKEQEVIKMEFLLTLNDRIIVQRLFSVKGYNVRAKNSFELYELVKEIKDEIHEDLRKKTIDYMSENKDQIIYDPSVLNTSMTNDDELFNIYIKVGGDVMTHRVFNAKIYPPKIRYTVDARPYLKNILNKLSDLFVEENLTYEYMGLPLEV